MKSKIGKLILTTVTIKLIKAVVVPKVSKAVNKEAERLRQKAGMKKNY